MMALEATSQTTLPVTSRVPRAVPRRLLFIVGGAAVGVIALVFMVLALSHGGTPATSKPKPTPTPTPAPVAATKPEPSAPAAPTPAAPTPAKPEPATPEPSAPPTAPVANPEPSGAVAAPATPSPPRPRHTLGGKKVVLEYDPKPTSPAPPSATAPTPMGEDPATVARAREAYHKGNVKLFAGDTAGAIALYRESLKIYPGYVAGYRGLGLGYEAAGNKDEALKAFHTYVRTVPSAADTTIIRRRIEHLESAKP
jgi:outer membrane biosynthesis protein TonB